MNSNTGLQSAGGRISVSMAGGVADVRLNRPDKMNALDQPMFDALIETGRRLAEDPGLRVVVLSGEGRAFCAGLDMGRFQAIAGNDAGARSASAAELRLLPRSQGIANGPQYAAMVWQDIPVPVIAAVHGVAYGGGFQVALGADVRLVSPDVRMSVMEIKWGLVPDMAGILFMRRLARADVIAELTYTGRVFSGAEAVEMGFATRVADEPHKAALEMANEIARKSPDAVRAAKRLLKLSHDADAATVLMAESKEQVALLGSANQVEAVTANLEKRLPVFSNVTDRGH